MQNIYAHQRQARRKTWLLVLLFLLAVFALIALAHWPIFWAMRVFGTDPHTLLYYGEQATSNNVKPHLGIAVIISGTILGAVLYKYLQLRKGGHVIASQLGAEQIQSNSYDPLERQLLNVVEEVAIAARMPVPSVFVLKRQPSINAFAAGYHTSDSIIAVTQGALTQLTRDQLQAVVAHEFSHIRHGDVRLNVRMSALLFGITFVGQAGERLIYSAMYSSSRHRGSSSDRSAAGFAVVLGLFLTIFGWLGTQLGDLIKACVCRQREFLADAGAAELTRAPHDLAQALLTIATSARKNTLRQNNAHLYSHLFFSDALNPWISWLSTHPPLTKRIKALDPSWDGEIVERPRSSVSANIMAAHAHSQLQSNYHAANELNQRKLEGIDNILCYLAHEPVDAQWLVMLLCLHDDWQHRQHQLNDVLALPYVDAYRFDMAESAISKLSSQQKFTLLEVAIGALRCLTKRQQSAYLKQLCSYVNSAQYLPLHSWAFWELTVHALSTGNATQAMTLSKKVVIMACEQLFNSLASFGHQDPQQQRAALSTVANELGFEITYLSDAQCQVVRLHRSLQILKSIPQTKKQALVSACYTCIAHDDEINENEQVLLYTLAACFDVDFDIFTKLPR